MRLDARLRWRRASTASGGVRMNVIGRVLLYVARCRVPENPCDEVMLHCPSAEDCAVIGHTLFDPCHIPAF